MEHNVICFIHCDLMDADECAAQGVKVHREAAENFIFQRCHEEQEQICMEK